METLDKQLSKPKKQRIIPPERRKKVAKACDSCKRRKQRCNGLLPCELCSLKGFKCEYNAIDRRVLKPSKKQLEERRRAEAEGPTTALGDQKKERDNNSNNSNNNNNTNNNNKQAVNHLQHPAYSNSPQYSSYPPDSNFFVQSPAMLNYQMVPQYQHQPQGQYLPPHPSNNIPQQQHQLHQQQQSQQQSKQPQALQPPQALQQPQPPTYPSQVPPQFNQTHPQYSQSYQGIPTQQQNTQETEVKTTNPSSLQSLLTFSVNIDPIEDSDQNGNIAAPEDGQNSRLLFDSYGNLCYFGECSPTSYHLQIGKLFETILGPNEFSYNPEKKPIVESSIFMSSKKPKFEELGKASNKLRERPYAEYLLKTYLNNSNNIVYIIDDEDLKIHLDRVYSNPNNVSPRDLCILNLVFAIGSIYAKIELSKNIFPFPSELFIDPDVFHEFAENILSGIDDFANVWLVEAYLFSFFYLQFSGKRNTAWIKLGLAIRYAQSLGLNRRYINGSFKEITHALHRRKLFRSLFIMDRLSAVYLGRSMSISEEDWDDLESFQNIGDFQSTLLEVARLNGKVLSQIYYNPSINLKQALQLQLELKNHSIANPIQQLTPEDYSRPVDHRYFLPHICHLHGIILLSRPYFQFIVLQKLSIVKYDTSSKNYAHLRNFYQSCIKSSLLIIKIVEYVYHQNIHPFKPLSLISCTFHAGLVIGVVLLLKFKNINLDILNDEEEKEVYKDIDSMVSQSMESVIQMLHTYGEIDSASKSYAIVLENLVKVTTPANSDTKTSKESNGENYPDAVNEETFIPNSNQSGLTQQQSNRLSYSRASFKSSNSSHVNNRANYQNILKFKDWLFPKLDTKIEASSPTRQSSKSSLDSPVEVGSFSHSHPGSALHRVESGDLSQHVEFLKDVAVNNHFRSLGPKFLDDFYFSVLDENTQRTIPQGHQPSALPPHPQAPTQIPQIVPPQVAAPPHHQLYPGPPVAAVGQPYPYNFPQFRNFNYQPMDTHSSHPHQNDQQR